MSLSPLASKTPGVYIDEVNAFPATVVPVATAIPAFIGYTPKASYQGQSYFNKPVKVNSFNEFKAYFMLDDPEPPAAPAKQYNPQYYIQNLDKTPDSGESYTINGETYSIEPDPGTIYYLYNSVRLFDMNWGGEVYIVSVGTYGDATGAPIKPGDPIVNPNVKLSELLGGLQLLKNVQEVTMYLVPEATLLSERENSILMQEMLLQCGEMKTAVSIFDIIGGRNPDPIHYTQDISNFRINCGNSYLDYGVAYYPYLNTVTSIDDEIDFNNLNGGDLSLIKSIVSPAEAPNPTAEHLIFQIGHMQANMMHAQINPALMNASKAYKQVMQIVLKKVNTLPPSGAMAAIYAMVDYVSGVYTAPANVTPSGVADLTLRIDDAMQADMNVDPVGGKSINAIRFFTKRGIKVWGARTLDGNSEDWRYINVRRTVTMYEQTIKLVLDHFVFAPNDAKTWSSVKGMLDNFLNGMWLTGVLQGATAAEAFSVSVGLGSSMTSQDILEGIMRVQVKIAIVQPAEFMIITEERQMAKS